MPRPGWRLIVVGVTLPFIGAACASPPEDHRPVADPWFLAYDEAVVLGEEYREANTRYYDAKDAAGEGEVSPIPDPTPTFAARARMKIEQHAGTDGEIPFLAWLVQNSTQAERMAMVERAMERHVSSPRLPTFLAAMQWASRSIGHDSVAEHLATILAENPHPEVSAEALYARGRLYIARYPAYPDPSAEEWRGVLADLERGVAIAKSLDGPRVGRLPIAPDQDILVRLEGILFEARSLRMGTPAPDIVGEDLDGVPFRLSDYRGNVVMLDFWGHW